MRDVTLLTQFTVWAHMGTLAHQWADEGEILHANRAPRVQNGGTGNAQVPFSSSKYIQLTQATEAGGGEASGNYGAPQAKLLQILGRHRRKLR